MYVYIKYLFTRLMSRELKNLKFFVHQSCQNSDWIRWKTYNL